MKTKEELSKELHDCMDTIEISAADTSDRTFAIIAALLSTITETLVDIRDTLTAEANTHHQLDGANLIPTRNTPEI